MISKATNSKPVISKEILKDIQDFKRDVQAHSLEAQKATQFTLLIGKLFSSFENLAYEYAKGTEKTVKIISPEGQRRGHTDAFFRYTLIEFERSLKRTGIEALRQLREYASGIINEEKGGRPPLICIASDGIEWRSYHPAVSKAEGEQLEPEDISLVELDSFNLMEISEAEFYFWLDRVFLRENFIYPTSETIQKEFGSRSQIFLESISKLARAYDQIKDDSEIKVAYNEWRNYLSIAYGEETTNEELYLRHTYLSVYARLLVWAAIFAESRQQPMGTDLSRILEGDAFAEAGFLNLHESGFFQWVTKPSIKHITDPLWHRIITSLAAYNLKEIDEDILKGVYQDLVDPSTRHDLGEYYTPDWLAYRITEHLLSPWRLKPRPPRILDPTCGSGTFLRIAIQGIRSNRGFKSRDCDQMLSIITSSVVGFDIHPLAVQIARANYALAIKDLVREARTAVEIPVYLANSLFLPRPYGQGDLLAGEMISLKFAGIEVPMPADILVDLSVYGRLIALADDFALSIEKGNPETEKSITNAIDQQIPAVSKKFPQKVDVIAQSTFQLANELARLRKERKDSIWTYILQNNYRPALMQRKFDIVVGNPPWISFRYISQLEYQKQLAELADRYSLAMSGKLRTHLEIATLFLLWSTESFCCDKGCVGFVMPRSLFNGDQHDAIRRGTHNGPCQITEVWDLAEVKPLFNVPSCVLFARQVSSKQIETNKKLFSIMAIKSLRFRAKFEAKNPDVTEAQNNLKSKKQKLYLNFIIGHSCWSDRQFFARPTSTSHYQSRFKQGATLVPRNYYFVSPAREQFDEKDEIYIKTDVAQASSAKENYKDIRMEGYVEGRFIFQAVIAKHLLPFRMSEPAWVVLPIQATDSGYTMLSCQELRARGYRKIATWMDKVELSWQEKRKQKSDKMTALAWLNYNNKLSAQNPSAKYLVCYNASGTNICADYIKPDLRPVIIDAKLYWYEAESIEEAEYLVGVLNSTEINSLIKPFQSFGLQGERDIHKKVLGIPIPGFNHKNLLHIRITELVREMQQKASMLDLPDESLARVRAYIRTALHDELKALDEMVKKLIEL